MLKSRSLTKGLFKRSQDDRRTQINKKRQGDSNMTKYSSNKKKLKILNLLLRLYRANFNHYLINMSNSKEMLRRKIGKEKFNRNWLRRFRGKNRDKKD